MFSHSITCSRCGSVNRFIVQGEILPMEDIHCSKCASPLGTWGDLEAAAGKRASDPDERVPRRGALPG